MQITETKLFTKMESIAIHRAPGSDGRQFINNPFASTYRL